MPIESIGAVTATAPTTTLQGAADPNGEGFASSLAGAVDNLQSMNAEKNTLAVQAVTGDLNDIHQATIAATRASTTLDLMVALRNKGVDAFNEVMRMQG